MREIKFRALFKCIASGKSCWQECMLLRGNIVDPTAINGWIQVSGWEQCIGLKDKNGVEIYEGDIIDLHQTVNGCNLFVVERKTLGWTVRYGVNMNTPRTYEYDIDSLFKPCEFSGELDHEVIGNIHETPELLNKD